MLSPGFETGLFMERLTDIGVVKELLARHNFTFSKALGQNFLVNPSVCPRIAEQGGAAPGVGVIEIGTGIGVLTAELARRADKVVAVELDSRLLPVLEETLRDFDNVKIINNDILKVDLHSLIREEFPGMEVVVCANLPYYITSPIIMGLLEERLPIKAITVMVQKEAAARLCAKPGTRDAGSVTIAVRYFSEPKQLFTVSRGSFMPSPNVDSAVIRLDIREPEPLDFDESFFFKVVRASFAQRRKTVVNSVSATLKMGKAEVAAALAQNGVKATARAEELRMDEFISLARSLVPLSQNKPKEAEQ